MQCEKRHPLIVAIHDRTKAFTDADAIQSFAVGAFFRENTLPVKSVISIDLMPCHLTQFFQRIDDVPLFLFLQKK